MTDEQIIKAWHCCENGVSCRECPYDGEDNCVVWLHSDVERLMQRQKAEIERLTERLEREAKFQYDLCGQIVDLKEPLKTARADAVREVISYIDEKRISYQRNFGTIDGVRKLLDHTKREMMEGE